MVLGRVRLSLGHAPGIFIAMAGTGRSPLPAQNTLRVCLASGSLYACDGPRFVAFPRAWTVRERRDKTHAIIASSYYPSMIARSSAWVYSYDGPGSGCLSQACPQVLAGWLAVRASPRRQKIRATRTQVSPCQGTCWIGMTVDEQVQPFHPR